MSSSECPHGFTSSLWCPECLSVEEVAPVSQPSNEELNSPPSPPSTATGQRVRVQQGKIERPRHTATNGAEYDFNDPTLGRVRVVGAIFNGRTWTAWTRSRWTGRCKKCRGDVEKGTPLFKSTIGDGKWVCHECFAKEPQCGVRVVRVDDGDRKVIGHE